ncbi:MAG: hypothetical protein AAGF11_13460 [Myxococcota bacterium]
MWNSNAWSPLTLFSFGAMLVLGACADDGGGTGSGSSGSEPTTGTSNPNPTQESLDTSGGPGGETTTTDDPTTTNVDTTMTTEDPTTGLPPGEADAFRFTSLTIRDPHFFDNILCTDITDTVNMQFADGLNMDSPDEPDGLLDLSLALVFRPANQEDGLTGDVDFANADCTAPADSTDCSLRENTELYPTTFLNMTAGTCHEADPAHLGGYEPPPGVTTGPCFATAPSEIVITTVFDLPLADSIISAQYMGEDNLIEGTIRGFLSAADAEATTLPDDLPVVGGNPISALLQGGVGGSAFCMDDDTDGDGWWFYVDFTAERVPWSE